MQELALTGAVVVTRDAAFSGTVVVRDGRVAAIDEGRSHRAEALDLEGDYLIPGLVELHTDNVEKHLVPRPGVVWPSPLAAMLAHDVQMAGAGITTVYDAISVGEYLDRDYRRALLALAVGSVRQGMQAGVFKADHRLHLRCEVSDDVVVELFEPYADDPLVGLISVMDHTPGQRQWRDMEKFRQFNQRKNLSAAEFDDYVRQRVDGASGRVAENRRAILDRWSPRGLPVASHDDTTPEHVDEAIADGIAISEFPTTLEAAERAKRLGMATVMGAPNLVRGESHSGNVSARELAESGRLDALSSDYAPFSLLHGAFLLHERVGMPLPDAIATVSANVADMLGLDDRGRIAPDRRADLVRVRVVDGIPIVRGVYVGGRQVA